MEYKNDEYQLTITSIEDSKIKRALGADDAYNALWNITQYLRAIERSEKEVIIEDIREVVNDLICDAGINMDDWS